jgi:hypothetical protein
VRLHHRLTPALDELRRECIRSMLICATLVAAAATAISAQSLTPIGARSSSAGETLTLVQSSDRAEHDPNHARRLLPAALGGLGGAVGFGVLASGIVGCPGSDCYGAIAVVIPAAILGGILGSATGASAHAGRGLCTRAQRFGMGVGGALLGAVAGVGLALVPPLFLGMVATIPAGSVMFMRRC